MLYDDFVVQVETCKDKLFELLKDKGVTDKVVWAEIIAAFASTEKHVSSDDFEVILRAQGIQLAPDSVALILSALAECGLAIEIQFEGEKIKRYEHLHPHAHHDHFICLKCKKIIEFSDDQLERLQEGLIFRKGWQPLFHKLEVYGICDICSFGKQKPMPVTFAQEGALVTIVAIDGAQALKKRLSQLGFVEGESIRIVKNSDFGPVVLEIKGTRMALGRGQAQHILVKDA